MIKNKTLKKLGIERHFLHKITDIYQKPTANIIFSGVRQFFSYDQE